LVNVTVALVLFVRVNVCGVLMAPTGCIPKSNGDGVTATVGISASFATNASEGGFRLPPVGREDRTGISVEKVWPVKYAFGGVDASIAIPNP
jgi:hypothetical protein